MGVGSNFDELLAGAQAGNEAAFSVLYREMNPRLLRYFSARAPREAQDLAADTWMGAARQLPSFRGGEQEFRRWLFTIAHHRLVQHWRRAGRRPNIVAGSTDPVGAPDDPPAGDRFRLAAGDSEEEAVGALSAGEAARRIAALLSPDQAEVILLRVLADLSVEQVAAVLGKRPGTVRVLQHRALRKLADENFPLAVTP